MPVFRVFSDRGIYFSENPRYERQEKLNSKSFSYINNMSLTMI